MSLAKLTCPSCGSGLKTAQEVPAGKKIRCPKCQAVFAAPGGATPPPASRPPSQPRPASRTPSPPTSRPNPRAASAERTRPETARPKPIKRQEIDEDEDDDDEEQVPVKRKGKGKPAKKRRGFPVVKMLVGGVALVGVVGSAIFATIWFVAPKKEPAAEKFVPPELRQLGMRGGIGRMPIMAAPEPANREPNLSAEHGFDDWMQDLEVAKQQAKSERRDLLILFNGSDWCNLGKELADHVLLSPNFRNQIRISFKLVFIDFPETPAGRAKVHDPARNERVAQAYGIAGFPTIILADEEGRPYAAVGYDEGFTPESYAGVCMNSQVLKSTRDNLFGEINRKTGLEKAEAAVNAVRFLWSEDLLGYYAAELDDWFTLVRQQDPQNEKGLVERVFLARLLRQLEAADPNDGATVLKAAAQLDDWKTRYKFKDPDQAFVGHLIAAHFLAGAGKVGAARDYLKAAVAYRPKDKRLQAVLKHPITALGLSTGTGFVVSADGMLLTNSHVVKDAARIMVQIPSLKDPLPAQVVAEDEARDIALLRLQGAESLGLKPLTLVDNPGHRGEQVGAFGFPLGDILGNSVKLATGGIAAPAEADNENGLLLDAKVNPGNSGGPLCDASGNVIGMVSRKSFRSEHVDSYGMAIPAKELQAFLDKHLKGSARPAANQQKKSWEEVDRLVSPSVFMVVRSAGRIERVFGGKLQLEPKKH